MTKYVRLPNGNKMQIYSCSITNSCILKFIDTDVQTVKNFLGNDLIDYIDIVDSFGKVLSTHQVNGINKDVLSTTEKITEQEKRLISSAYDEEVTYTDENGEEKSKIVYHEPQYEIINKDKYIQVIVAPLEIPTISDQIKQIKDEVGIVSTNNMTLDEFREYYKSQIGKECREKIETGVDVETSKGVQHFSYNSDDQSNIKDLIITTILSLLLQIILGKEPSEIHLPYHADKNLCTIYSSEDILKAYMMLSANKTYHTTYCNILNNMLYNATDMESIKNITYGMEITDKKYLDVLNEVNNSKDILLNLAEQLIEKMNSKEENVLENEKKNQGVDNE